MEKYPNIADGSLRVLGVSRTARNKSEPAGQVVQDVWTNTFGSKQGVDLASGRNTPARAPGIGHVAQQHT